MTTTKIKDPLIKELEKKRREYKNVINNESDKLKYSRLNQLESEINQILYDIKDKKKQILNKNKYYMKNLKI